MKRILVLAVIIVSFIASYAGTYTMASSQASDPCLNKVPPRQIGLNHEGHCIVVEPEKGPVQGIFVRRVEDLDNVRIYGIIVSHTESGWRILDEEFVEDVAGGQFAKVAVGDGYHIELDPIEE